MITGGPVPSRGVSAVTTQHTRWQRLLRDVFKILGPAQTGLPPYATPEEREAWQRGNAPLPPPRPAFPRRGAGGTSVSQGRKPVGRVELPG